LSTSSTGPNMAASAPAEGSSGQVEEERLAHALVSRGLVTREEVQPHRSASPDGAGPQPFLTRLVKAGALTSNQAKRAFHELSALLHQQIPGYLLVSKLGQGSMGTVYKARQLSMNRLVAIKMLHPKLAAKQELLSRLVREAHLAAKLSHNNIVNAIDVGSAGNLHYFVMEYVEGTTLKQELEKGKIYEEAEAVDIVIQIAQALEHAHRRGLIHRDIKPANIILTKEGVAKLADLGMAREQSDEEMAKAEKGMTIGTPYYIAPEQITAEEDIDGRADIYSLGATLYHMVTGQPPFPGTKIDVVLDAHLKKELTPPDHLNTKLSSGLGEVVEFMLAKNRAQRYQKPDDLIFDLECLLNGRPPKLARERIKASTLEALAEGEEAEGDDKSSLRSRRAAAQALKKFQLYLAIVGVVAGLSALLNLILLIRR
jgi:eukaryotic-like serine/threonine-protein kinase